MFEKIRSILFAGVLIVSLVLGIAGCAPQSKTTPVAQSGAAANPPKVTNIPPTEPPTPTNTKAPTNTPKPTATQAPTNTPRPTPTPTPIPLPIILSGSGDDVVDLDKWDGPAIAKISNDGGGNFAVWNYGPDGERIDLLINTIGKYQGTLPIDFGNDEMTSRFEIKSDGTWEIDVEPLYSIRRETIPGTIEGIGDDVIALIGNSPDIMTIDASHAEGNLVIWTYGDYRDLAVNEIAPYQGKVILPSDTVALAIKAEGPWSLEISTR